MGIPDALKRFPIVEATYRVFCNFGRLNLPEINPDELANLSRDLIIPVDTPLSADLDCPNPDLFFLLLVAKKLQPHRVLEVGTFRARTACALKLNCPKATVVSYDIATVDSPYRLRLEELDGVELRIGSFAEADDKLRGEEKFDLIFIDGSHLFADVLADSRLAAKVISDRGVIVWHDYRPNIPVTHRLRVPEALDCFAKESGRKIYHVVGTTCAIHGPSLLEESPSRR
jgi:predicted O-methyltransferase YrrM